MAAWSIESPYALYDPYPYFNYPPPPTTTTHQPLSQPQTRSQPSAPATKDEEKMVDINYLTVFSRLDSPHNPYCHRMSLFPIAYEPTRYSCGEPVGIPMALNDGVSHGYKAFLASLCQSWGVTRNQEELALEYVYKEGNGSYTELKRIVISSEDEFESFWTWFGLGEDEDSHQEGESFIIIERPSLPQKFLASKSVVAEKTSALSTSKSAEVSSAPSISKTSELNGNASAIKTTGVKITSSPSETAKAHTKSSLPAPKTNLGLANIGANTCHMAKFAARIICSTYFAKEDGVFNQQYTDRHRQWIQGLSDNVLRSLQEAAEQRSAFDSAVAEAIKEDSRTRAKYCGARLRLDSSTPIWSRTAISIFHTTLRDVCKARHLDQAAEINGSSGEAPKPWPTILSAVDKAKVNAQPTFRYGVRASDSGSSVKINKATPSTSKTIEATPSTSKTIEATPSTSKTQGIQDKETTDATASAMLTNFSFAGILPQVMATLAAKLIGLTYISNPQEGGDLSLAFRAKLKREIERIPTPNRRQLSLSVDSGFSFFFAVERALLDFNKERSYHDGQIRRVPTDRFWATQAYTLLQLALNDVKADQDTSASSSQDLLKGPCSSLRPMNGSTAPQAESKGAEASATTSSTPKEPATARSPETASVTRHEQINGNVATAVAESKPSGSESKLPVETKSAAAVESSSASTATSPQRPAMTFAQLQEKIESSKSKTPKEEGVPKTQDCTDADEEIKVTVEKVSKVSGEPQDGTEANSIPDPTLKYDVKRCLISGDVSPQEKAAVVAPVDEAIKEAMCSDVNDKSSAADSPGGSWTVLDEFGSSCTSSTVTSPTTSPVVKDQAQFSETSAAGDKNKGQVAFSFPLRPGRFVSPSGKFSTAQLEEQYRTMRTEGYEAYKTLVAKHSQAMTTKRSQETTPSVITSVDLPLQASVNLQLAQDRKRELDRFNSVALDSMLKSFGDKSK